MIACCTIAYLVACKSGFTPEEVEVARSRIRVCLGTLKHYENIWPRAKNILRELRVIANALKRADAVPRPLSVGFDTLSEQDAMISNIFDGEWFNALGAMT